MANILGTSGAKYYEKHDILYEDFRDQIEEAIKGCERGTKCIRFSEGKITLKKKPIYNVRSNVAQARHFAKALYRSIENQVGQEAADKLLSSVMNKDGSFNLFAAINIEKWRKIDRAILRNNRTRKIIRKTPAKFGHGVQSITYNKAQISDFQESINEAARRDFNDVRKKSDSGANAGLDKDFIKDFGRCNYVINGKTLASPTLEPSPTDQQKNCGETLRANIKDRSTLDDMRTISSILHQGIFAFREYVARKCPENSHPIPFIFGLERIEDNHDMTSYGSFFNIKSTSEPGKYHFTAFQKSRLSIISAEYGRKRELVFDYCDVNSSYVSTAFTGTIDVNDKEAPVELVDARLEYQANRLPNSAV